MRVDSMPALRSLVDHLVRGEGRVPMLSAYVPDAVHHRVVVVGERAVASYENPIEDGDFRSSPSDDRADYRAEVPRDLAEPAIAAVRALRLLFGGVDLLRHASGRVYVLEANFPCFFPQATLGGGLDVAGPMVDFLAARARAMLAGRPRG
jgi:glutathione synthase/RimK-type ligase-like ATP-grasp enzyme